MSEHIFASITFGNVALTIWLFAFRMDLTLPIVVSLYYLCSSLYFKEFSISPSPALFDILQFNVLSFLFHCFESWLSLVCFELAPPTNFHLWLFHNQVKISQSAIVRVEDVPLLEPTNVLMLEEIQKVEIIIWPQLYLPTCMGRKTSLGSSCHWAWW